MNWVEKVYPASSDLPKAEVYGLTSQLRRAAAWVPSNIAEEAERPGTREFLQFLGIALGSLAEAETLILLASRLRYLEQPISTSLLAEAGEIGRMLHGFRRSLSSRG